MSGPDRSGEVAAKVAFVLAAVLIFGALAYLALTS